MVPSVLVAGWYSLDHTSMSRTLVSNLIAINSGWLKIAANLACDCKRFQLDWMILRIWLVVQQTDDWSLFGSCFVVGLKSLLTWKGFDLLKSSSNYVFRVVSLDEEFNHLLCFVFEVCVIRTQVTKSQELRSQDVLCTQNMHWDGSSFTWHQPCKK